MPRPGRRAWSGNPDSLPPATTRKNCRRSTPRSVPSGYFRGEVAECGSTLRLVSGGDLGHAPPAIDELILPHPIQSIEIEHI